MAMVKKEKDNKAPPPPDLARYILCRECKAPANGGLFLCWGHDPLLGLCMESLTLRRAQVHFLCARCGSDKVEKRHLLSYELAGGDEHWGQCHDYRCKERRLNANEHDMLVRLRQVYYCGYRDCRIPAYPLYAIKERPAMICCDLCKKGDASEPNSKKNVVVEFDCKHAIHFRPCFLSSLQKAVESKHLARTNDGYFGMLCPVCGQAPLRDLHIHRLAGVNYRKFQEVAQELSDVAKEKGPVVDCPTCQERFIIPDLWQRRKIYRADPDPTFARHRLLCPMKGCEFCPVCLQVDIDCNCRDVEFNF